MSGGGLFVLYAGKHIICKEYFAIIPFFGRWEKTTIVSCVAFALPAEKLFIGGRYQYLSFSKKR